MFPAVMLVYRRSDVVMARGEGCYLFDVAGKRYLDFATGIAVNALGHGHPHLVEALKTQAELLWHCSNLYRIPEQERLATRLVEATFADSVFFCSTGTEAVEAGMKIMRRSSEPRYRIITFEGGFHGRSFAGISAGGNAHARAGYAPLLPGFDCVAFGDLGAVAAAIGPETAGILIEVIQGEGGIRVASPEFLQGLRALADAHGILLMCDEVQCGMGRSGSLFAYEQAGITPDIISIAKGVGGGFPLAACLATEAVASCMTPGSHGSTYGSNPLAMAVGNAVLDIMLTPDFLPYVRKASTWLREALADIASTYPQHIVEVRGVGLMLGLQMHGDHYTIAAQLRENGLLTAPAVADRVIRILPPLIITQAHVQEAHTILHRILGAL